jgi:tetratricopeptide (TPR) repeat protein
MLLKSVSGLSLLIFIIIIQSSSLAQIKWPQSPENLQVLPKNTKIDQLRKIMGSFTEALGVRCSNCHFMSDPNDVSTFDFSSDKVPNKNIARKMLKMMNNINEGTISEIAEFSKEKNPVGVNCYTCHRGYEKPILLEDVLYSTVKDSGIESGLNQYKFLRNRFYGKGTFDFSEESLVKLGNKLEQGNNPNEAIAFLKLNSELYQDSPIAFQGLSEGYITAGDFRNAVSCAEKVISLLDKVGNNNDRGDNRLRKQAKEIIDKYKNK